MNIYALYYMYKLYILYIIIYTRWKSRFTLEEAANCISKPATPVSLPARVSSVRSFSSCWAISWCPQLIHSGRKKEPQLVGRSSVWIRNKWVSRKYRLKASNHQPKPGIPACPATWITWIKLKVDNRFKGSKTLDALHWNFATRLYKAYCRLQMLFSAWLLEGVLFTKAVWRSDTT